MRTERKSASAMACRGFMALAALIAGPDSYAHEDEVRGAPGAGPAVSSAVPAGPRALAETFNRALAIGDAGTVRALLLPDVLIYESGGAETSAAEYAGQHMPGDMAFLANLKREPLSQESGGGGATAWVATRSRLTGRFKGKDMDLDSTETLVMAHTEAGWRIAHVHWSSAPHRGPTP